MFEELIVRAFMMTEVKALTGSAVIAIVASVLFQSAYHRYQGVLPAVLYSSMFLVFALYYAIAKRVAPVVLAHFYFDLAALVYYSIR